MPDVYIASDGDYLSSFLNISIMDVKHNKKFG
jgi:hypothetical protein